MAGVNVLTYPLVCFHWEARIKVAPPPLLFLGELYPLHQVVDLNLLRQGYYKVLVHGNHRVYVDLALVDTNLELDRRVGAVGLGLELQPLQDLLLHRLVLDGIANTLGIARLDQRRVLLRLALELALGHKLAKVNSPAQSLQHGNVARGAATVVLLQHAPVLAAKGRADTRQEGVNVELLDLVVDVDVVGMQDLRISDWRQDGLVELVAREEGVLVGRLEAADQGLELLLLKQVPVHKTEVGASEGHGAGGVDVAVEWELHALNQVEGDGIFEADQLEADAREVEGFGRVREVDEGVHVEIWWAICCLRSWWMGGDADCV